MRVRLLAVGIAAVLVCAQAAQGAAWKQVTANGGGNTDQVALARSADGVLHVAWRLNGSTTSDLFHTPIAANGTVGSPTAIVSGWDTIGNPALVSMPGGLRVFFGAIRSLNPADPQRELNTALSSNGGLSWGLQGGSVVPIGAQAYGGPVSAAVLGSGSPLEAWAGSLGTWVHAGLDPSTPNYEYQNALGHYGYDVGIAAGGTQAFIAWYSNATGHLGVYAHGVAANGSPLGPLLRMPSTANMNVGMIGRTPIVARPGGGFWVAFATGYPSLNRVRLWKVGAPGTFLMAKTVSTNSTTSLAADPSGRIWVIWTDNVNGFPHVFARRSNPAVTQFGAVIDAGRPKGAASIYRLDANATAGALDLFGAAAIGTSPSVSTFYRRILPGLTLTASPARLHRGKTTDVTFKVRDAGVPVAGATVRAGGHSGTTRGKGNVTLTLTGGKAKRVPATATANGYAPGHFTLHVAKK